MKRLNLHSTPNNVMAGRNGTLPLYVAETAVSVQLQQSLLQVAELKQILETSQQQLKAAQQHIELLTETNTSLKQKLIRLAKKYAHARHFGYYDELTGLPNRSLLQDRFKQAIVQSTRQDKQVALLFIDLDKFKNVNDNLGHVIGDKVLQQVAERLTASIRYGDTACRYGGDEFIIMLPEIDSHESVAVVTEKIRTHLAANYVLDGNVVTVTASIGTAVGKNYSDLIKQADNAMYKAKTKTKEHSNLPGRSLQSDLELAYC